MLGVHPTGLGSKAATSDLNVSFGPDEMNPDFGGELFPLPVVTHFLMDLIPQASQRQPVELGVGRS